MKDLVRRIIPYRIRRSAIAASSLLFNAYSQRSFSQEGEDLILHRLIGDKQKGFYVDVGAHHPKLFSNTYFFYNRGWRGINIDATPGSMRSFRLVRPRDINIEVAVSSRTAPIPLSLFDEPALNSFNPTSISKDKREEYIEYKTVELIPLTLAEILESKLQDNQEIDFLTVDVEGEDIFVLESNNWLKFRPNFILVEDSKFRIENPGKSEVFNLLTSEEYNLRAKTLNTLIFEKTTSMIRK